MRHRRFLPALLLAGYAALALGCNSGQSTGVVTKAPADSDNKVQTGKDGGGTFGKKNTPVQ